MSSYHGPKCKNVQTAQTNTRVKLEIGQLLVSDKPLSCPNLIISHDANYMFILVQAYIIMHTHLDAYYLDSCSTLHRHSQMYNTFSSIDKPFVSRSRGNLLCLLNDETVRAKEANSKKKDSLNDGSSESLDGDFVRGTSWTSGGGGSGPDCGSLCSTLQKSVSCTLAHGK